MRISVRQRLHGYWIMLTGAREKAENGELAIWNS